MNINRDRIILGDIAPSNNDDKFIYTNNQTTGTINFDRGGLKMGCLGGIPDDSAQYIVGVDTLDGNRLKLQTRPLGGGGGGGGDVFLNGNVATSKNIFGVGVTNEYQHKELYITGSTVEYNTGSIVNLNTGSSIEFKDTAVVKFAKNEFPAGNGKYLITDGLGILQQGLSIIPINDVDGLVSTLSSISGSISANTQEILAINTITLPPISSTVASNLGKITIVQGDIGTINNTTIPNLQSSITANTTAQSGLVSKTNPNTVSATNTWSGSNIWSQAGGNRFTNDIVIGSGSVGAGYLDLQDNRLTLWCGGTTKGFEIDCLSAFFYGTVQLGFSNQIGLTTITNGGQALLNPIGFQVDTSSDFRDDVTINKTFNLKSFNPPTSGTSNGIVGDIVWGLDGSIIYLYLCHASNTWSRVQLNTF